LIILRVFHGLTFGLAGTAIGTIVVDSVPTTRMSEGIGYFGLTPTISMSLAPMIGLWLVGRFSYSVLFTVVSTMIMLALIFGFAVRNANVHVRAPANSVAGTLSNLIEKTALLPSVVTFFLSLINGAMLFYIVLYAAGLGIRNIGLFFATSSLCMAISRPLSGRWADRGGAGAVILIGLLTLLTGIMVISFSHTLMGFLLAGAFAGLGFGFCIPTLQALAVRHATSDRRGAATGTYFAAFDMGLGLGAILWGAVAEASGYRLMYFSTIVPLALAGVVCYRFRARMSLP
jgi:MFS family permease